MKTIAKPYFIDIPCGKTLGHGESCCEGRLCEQCEYIKLLEKLLIQNGYKIIKDVI